MTRPATVDESLVTAQGHKLLSDELAKLRLHGRRDLSERLQRARQDGHLGDNPALDDALAEQAQLEARIATLEAQLGAARIAEPPVDGSVGVGSSVRVRHLDSDRVAEYELVGVIDPGIGDRRISLAAPVGQALVGRRAGARVDVIAPRGVLALEILHVQPPERSQAA
jgi:transcription elongation factor GreA